ncbi:MAG: redoxin family protein [Planctomycetaceae bacterium]|nr:redoxin family protein [Planctomycetaceae bacterium]
MMRYLWGLQNQMWQQLSLTVLGSLAFLLLTPGSLAAEADVPIGSVIGDLRFRDIRALDRTLSELGQNKATVLVFTTTTCPLVRRSIPKLEALNKQFSGQGVQFVAVNVGADDTIREMAEQALEMGATFPFVKDADLSCQAALGVTKTPEVAVLDHNRALVYRGRIDDQLRLGGTLPKPSREDLRQALVQLLAGEAITVSETPVDGCEITHPTLNATMKRDVEYHRDIAPLLDRKCNQCHREGTAAPFTLQSLTDVSANAAMIARVVEDERMPPWFASEHHGRFQNNASLSRREKAILLSWISLGCPEGSVIQKNASAASPNVDKAGMDPSGDSEGWLIGKPDVVITMLEHHEVPETGFVPYRYTVLPYFFLQDTWVEAFEIRPNNREVVHHCNMAYVGAGGAGVETFITGYVPGGQPMDLGRFDNGTAYFIPKGSGLGLQIHYTTTGQAERCQISVGLRFPRRTVQKRLTHFLLDPRRFRIPPGDGAYEVRSSRTLDQDIDLLGMFTHMHVRGKDMTFFAERPGQKKEILLRIPNYNFEWQLGYELKPGDVQLPKGTKIEAVAHFDNSAFNPFNPDPSRTVGYGLQTVDEMFNGFVFFVDRHEQLNLEVDPHSGRVIPP